MDLPKDIRLTVAAIAMACAAQVAAQTVAPVLEEGQRRVAEGQQAQRQVGALADEADSSLQQYRHLLKEIEGLNTYNSLLQQQVDGQHQEMEALRQSIEQVSVVERQIIPLMVRMIDAIDEFIGLDVPFLLEERGGRVQRLRRMMQRPDVSASEKLRRVLEAFQIENEYGRTLEAYRGKVEIMGKEYEADFLRIGRVALLAQTLGGELSLAWHEGQWQELSASQYRQHLSKGLQVARKQIAPDLLWVPLPEPEQ